MKEKAANRVLITSGPTRAYFDRIRYIANTSSGALGSLIADAVLDKGFPVAHLYGEGSMTAQSVNPLYEAIVTPTLDDVLEAARSVCGRGDVGAVVHAMAVLDYAPERRLDEKKKSGDEFWDIRLVRTPKIVSIIRAMVPASFFIGFKLESGIDEEELIERAVALLEKNRLDAVVANRLERVGGDRHEAIVIGVGGYVLARAETKAEIADLVAGMIEAHLGA